MSPLSSDGLASALRDLTDSTRAKELALKVVDANESLVWETGACGLLAEAVKMALPEAVLMLAKDEKGQTQHCLAKVGEYLYDGNGLNTEESLRSYWRLCVGVTLGPLLPLEEWPEDLPRDTRTSRRLASLLRPLLA